jgi:hypothetical protein
VLDAAARKWLSAERFRIPPDWSSKGGEVQRFHVGVIFELIGGPRVARFEDKRRTVVMIGLPLKM